MAQPALPVSLMALRELGPLSHNLLLKGFKIQERKMSRPISCIVQASNRQCPWLRGTRLPLLSQVGALLKPVPLSTGCRVGSNSILQCQFFVCKMGEQVWGPGSPRSLPAQFSSTQAFIIPRLWGGGSRWAHVHAEMST